VALCIMSKCGCVRLGGAQVGFRVGYDIPKNVGMTMIMAKGEAWCFQFLKLRGDLGGLGVKKG